MNTRRSYLDTLNAGRQRRPAPSPEDLDRTLASLEAGGQPAAPRTAPPPLRNEAWQPRGEAWQPRRESRQPPAAPARPAAYDVSDLKALAREMERARRQEDGIAGAGRIAAELKTMREELRQQMNHALKREFDALRQDIQRLGATEAPVSGRELGAEFERLSDAVRALSERGDDRSVNLLRLELEQVKGALDQLAREDTLKSVGRRWDDFDRKWSSLETKLGKDAARTAAQPDIGALSAQIERMSQTVNSLPESLSLRSLDERLRVLAATVDHFAAQYANAMPEAFGLIEQRLDEISRAIVASGASARPASFDPEPFERIEARVSGLARQIDELMDGRQARVDPEPFERIEAHVAGLARQIDELLDEQASGTVIDRLTMLSQRVDDLAGRVDIPEAVVERLGRQIADVAARIEIPETIVERLGHQIASISARLDREPDPSSRAEAIVHSLEDRFAELSHHLERRQGDAMEQGHHLFRELERRLDDVAQRIEARETAPAGPDPSLIDAIEQRFADLTARLQGSAAGERTAIVGLEARLDDISRRLEQSARHAEGVDPEMIRSLEAQVASLSAHLSRPGTPLPEFEDIAPRLDHIERSLSDNREAILEAARRAAQDAVHSMSQSAAAQGDPAALAGFAAEVKALEAMTRKSDERNARTFEAIHDMLIKVVDRLGSLEQSGIQPAPAAALQAIAEGAFAQPAFEADEAPLQRAARQAALTPAEAAAAAASHALGEQKPAQEAVEGRRSMLAGLTRAFRKDRDAAPEPEAPAEVTVPAAARLDEPLDPKLANEPLEPGSGAPDVSAIIRRVRDEASATPTSAEAAKSDFIAAARRAAQAAAAEAQITKRGADMSGAASRLKLGGFLKNSRKSVLMAATGLIVVLGGWQITRAFLSSEPRPAVAVVDTVPAPAPAAPLLSEALPDEDEAEFAEGPAVRIVDSALGDDEDGMAGLPAGAPVMAAAPQAAGARDALPEARREPAAAFGWEPAPVEAGPVALREAADGGDPKAMFEIASRYAEGRGVAADLATAAEWYRRSAELGYAPAQYRLGNFHEKGNGVDRDPEQAMTWYERAAKQGNASAMHNLAVLHAMGATGAADNDAAARWFLEAAELGVTDSQYNLGILAAKGAGVPQSLEESYKWFALVAKAGDRDAAAKRDEVAKALRPEQLAKAKAAADLWKARPVDPETNVVDIPEEWTEGQPVTASIADMKQAIRNIQAILNKNGYEAGTADGVIGNKTRSAIMAFQADNGMTADGEVTDALIQALLARR